MQFLYNNLFPGLREARCKDDFPDQVYALVNFRPVCLSKRRRRCYRRRFPRGPKPGTHNKKINLFLNIIPILLEIFRIYRGITDMYT